MSKKLAILGFIVVVTALIGIGSYLIINNKNDNQPTDVKGTQTTINTASDSVTGLQFKYDSALKLQELSQQDVTDKFIFRLASTDPAILVSIRYEEGLSAVSALANQDIYNLLVANTLKALPQRYPDFKLQNQQKLQIAGREALDIVFTYTGPNGSEATQRFIVLVKDPNTAIYISAQTSTSDFKTLNTNYLDPLIFTLTLK